MIPSYWGLFKYSFTSLWGLLALACVITLIIVVIMVVFGYLSWWWILAWPVLGIAAMTFGGITAAKYAGSFLNNANYSHLVNTNPYLNNINKFNRMNQQFQRFQ